MPEMVWVYTEHYEIVRNGAQMTKFQKVIKRKFIFIIVIFLFHFKKDFSTESEQKNRISVSLSHKWHIIYTCETKQTLLAYNSFSASVLFAKGKDFGSGVLKSWNDRKHLITIGCQLKKWCPFIHSLPASWFIVVMNKFQSLLCVNRIFLISAFQINDKKEDTYRKRTHTVNFSMKIESFLFADTFLSYFARAGRRNFLSHR